MRISKQVSKQSQQSSKYSQTVGGGIMKRPAIKVPILDEPKLNSAMHAIFQRGYDERDVAWFLQHVVRSFCVAVLRDGPPDFDSREAHLKLLILHGSTRNVSVIQHKEVSA